MSQVIASGIFQLLERHGPADRLLLRGQTGDCLRWLVFSGYEGPELPDTLTSTTIRVGDSANGPGTVLRIASNEGSFDCRARTVDCVDECPALYEPLHRQFVMKVTDRLAVRVLLGLLRLPGGARLMRLWHSRRGR